jgi:2-polyprenyl-6-methoxyphenol hydroxylase-like FAD-dependent oxidoreductase
MIMPQADFLQFLADEAAKSASFEFLRGAHVQQLVEEQGVARGVRWQTNAGWQELRAELTVAADGRFSRVRKLAGVEPVRFAPPMDVLWLRLPRRRGDDPDKLTGRLHIGGGHFAVLFDRPTDEWQIGYAILKGSFAELKSQGIEALRGAVAQLLPLLADRVDVLEDFKQITILSVDVSRIPRWHKPGLLLIGDAAHVMSPVGGIGIQYAVQDAVAASNLLAAPLRARRVSDAELAAVQRLREPAVKKAQWFQGLLQQKIVAQALRGDRSFRLPPAMRLLLHLPWLRNIPAQIIGRGFDTVELSESQTR